MVLGPPAQAVPVPTVGPCREPAAAAALPVAPSPIPPPEQSQARRSRGCMVLPPQKDRPTEWCQVMPAACKVEVDVTELDFCVCVCIAETLYQLAFLRTAPC